MTSGAAPLHDEVADRLAAVNQRYPDNRKRLVEALFDADQPLTVPDLLEALGGGVAQSSVYRNLDHLVEAGIVQKVVGSDDNGRFELTEELSGHHHHHLICSVCGSVYDIASTSRLEKALSDAAQAALEDAGFQVTDHRIDLVGICNKH